MGINVWKKFLQILGKLFFVIILELPIKNGKTRENHQQSKPHKYSKQIINKFEISFKFSQIFSPIILNLYRPPKMKSSTLISLALLAVVSSAAVCDFPPYTTDPEYCLPNGSGACSECVNGYGLTNSQCYPPCPSGFTQLLPGYCLNTTVINQHKNFTLCPTNMFVEISGGLNMCEGTNPTCQCMPACPNGYIAVGDTQNCQCVYQGNQLYGADASKPCLSFYILIALVSMAAFVGFSYLGYRVYNNRAKPINRAIEVPYVNMNSEILAH